MSRTDKGVHASLSAVTFKGDIKLNFIKGVETVEELKKRGKKELMHDIQQEKIIDKMNEYFENSNEPIRMFGSRLLKKKYYLRKRATDRTYHYILPISLFYRFKNSEGGSDIAVRNADDIVNMLSEVMPLIEGSQSFHSYTSLKMLGDIKIKFDPEGKLPPKADQLQRYVMGFTVQKYDQNPNWLKFQIHG